MAARKPPLRAVVEGEKPPARVVPRSVVEAAKDGTTRDLLVAMRARIAKTVDDPRCPPVALAALTKRLDELTQSIVAIDARERQEAESGDVPDEAFDASAI